VDPFGKVMIGFGVVGEDGSVPNHGIEDGRAVRHEDVTQPILYYN